jgi:AraC-like DNA-binding protein
MHDLTPMGIARQCGVSRSYLYQLFSDGPPIMERVRRRRLRAAREMIERGGGMSITDIAMNCGFSSSSELSRQFRAEYGVAPRDFARRARMA